MPKMTRHVRAAVVDPQTEWTRRKLQFLLTAAVTVVVAIAAGGVWTVTNLLSGGADRNDPGADRTVESSQDRLANRALAAAPLEAAQPGNLSTGETGTLRIPMAAGVGAAAVATGFPRTPEGALAQLAAINQAALASASVRVAQEVIIKWAAPGGPTTETWSGVKAVAALLAAAGMPADGTGDISIDVEPKMGFIKGAIGDDFVIPCIDFIVTATTPAGRAQQVAAADCQRMVWKIDTTGGRWVIGPGQEPAEPPSLWPGSQASFDAGYEWLEVSP